MKKIHIITDSACDLPLERLRSYDVEVLPLYVTQGEIIFRDGIDILPETIYRQMAEGVIYKTSQIPYMDYFQCFERHAQEKQPALYLCFSSGLSGTFQTAQLACHDVCERYPDADIRVIDTKAVTGGPH